MLSCDENAISVPLAPVSGALAETACVSYIDPTIGRPELIAPAQVNQRRYEALRAYPHRAYYTVPTTPKT
jgi:hypothetical protein